MSTWRQVTSGVPQGSILGSIIFLLYVNDLPDAAKSSVKMFADDTKLYTSIKTSSDCKILQQDLNSMSAWAKTWMMRFNAEKCVVVKIKESLEYFYSLNGHYLEVVHDQKDLGVTISDNLKPAKHIENIVKSARQKTGMIRRCFSNLTPEKITKLYTTIIRPALEYASIVWSPHLKKDKLALETVQRRCLKLCNQPLMLEPLESRRKKTDLTETYKFLNGNYKSDRNLVTTNQN